MGFNAVLILAVLPLLTCVSTQHYSQRWPQVMGARSDIVNPRIRCQIYIESIIGTLLKRRTVSTWTVALRV